MNKTNLLPHLDFDTGRYAADLSRVSPRTTILPVATTGEGIAAWYDWLRGRVRGAPARLNDPIER